MTRYQTFTFFLIEEHTYLLWDETGEACVVDAGMFREEERKAFGDFLTQNGLRLVRAIHTHLHFDHFLGAKWIGETYGITPEAPQSDIEDKLELSRGLVEDQGEIARVIQSTDFAPLPGEGSIVTFGNSSLKILSVPGHTRGHVAFYDPKAGLVISGDVLFKGGIGRTDLFGGDYEELLTSIHTRLFSLPDETKVLPGHGPETTVGTEKADFGF